MHRAIRRACVNFHRRIQPHLATNKAMNLTASWRNDTLPSNQQEVIRSEFRKECRTRRSPRLPV